MNQKKTARLVSFLFDPLIEGVVLLLLLFLTKSSAPLWLLAAILFLCSFLPVLFLAFGLRFGLISDWETTNRRERYGLNLVCLLGVVFSLILVFFYGDQFLGQLLLFCAILLVIYTLITFFWKISGHTTANAAFIFLVNHFFGWTRFWWLVFLLPLVAWARLKRNKHDFWQLLAGVVLVAGVSLFWL